MKTVGATEFKEQCLELLDQLDVHGLVITKNGKPVAKVIPYEQKCTERQWAALNGSLRDKVKIKGAIYSTGILCRPVLTSEATLPTNLSPLPAWFTAYRC